jgi:hypothetical protein
VFPTNGSVTRPLPSLLAGFLGFGFPTFHRYYERAKTSRVHPARSVSFAWRYRSLRSGVSLSWMPDAPSTSLGLGLPDGPCRRCRAEINGISQVPREPTVHLPCSQTPAGPSSPSHYSESVLPPQPQRRRLLRPAFVSRLYHTAFALAVYASCRHY